MRATNELAIAPCGGVQSLSAATRFGGQDPFYNKIPMADIRERYKVQSTTNSQIH